MSRLRVAIAGAGIGGAHLEGYLACPDLYEVVTICDPIEKRAQRLIKHAKCDYNETYQEALQRDDIDVLDVCLPPDLHKPAIFDGLAAGKHVICEKPLVRSLEDADTVIEAAAASTYKVIPIFQYRFGNGIGALGELIKQDMVGRPLVATLETHWRREPEYYSVPWRGKWATELGGAIVGHAIHAHDLLVQVMGPIESVQANLATRANDIEVEDCGSIIMRMACGALVTSSITLGHTSDESRLKFCFSKLSAESPKGVEPYNPGAGPWTMIAQDANEQAAVDEIVNAYTPHAEGFARQLELAHGTITQNLPAPVPLEDARAALALITAIYRSNEEGRRIDLAEQAPDQWYRNWQPNSGLESAFAS